MPKILDSLQFDKDELVKACAVRGLVRFTPEPTLVANLSRIEHVASDHVRSELAILNYEWYGEASLAGVARCFLSNDYHCYMRPIWYFKRCPDFLLEISDDRLEAFQACVDRLADELDVHEAPAWQAKEAREWSAEIGAHLAARAI